MSDDSYLSGRMLIAMPGIGDPRFERTLIYMCAHSSDGAMGIVVNKEAENITFPDLLERLGVIAEAEEIRLPSNLREMPVQIGGPVETGRGFVLHSSDYHVVDSTLSVDDTVGLTATLDVLKALADGSGPEKALLALGYSGWGPGQLEGEIQNNGWLHCDADDLLVFDGTLDNRYDQALAKIGVDPALLSSDAGHA